MLQLRFTRYGLTRSLITISIAITIANTITTCITITITIAIISIITITITITIAITITTCITITITHFGTPDCVEALVKLKADVNYKDEDGSSALILAAYSNRPELVEALATHVGDDLKVDPSAHNNTSALYLAAQEGYVDVVKALLCLKPDHVQKFIDTKSAHGIAPLYLAAHAGEWCWRWCDVTSDVRDRCKLNNKNCVLF